MRKAYKIIFLFFMWMLCLQLHDPYFSLAEASLANTKVPHFFSQSPTDVSKYILRFSEGILQFSPDRINFNIVKTKTSNNKFNQEFDKNITWDQLIQEHIQIIFEGCNKKCSLKGLDPLASSTNYFMGSEMSNWKSGLQNYNALFYKDLYPKIDLKYYVIGKEIKYDYILLPGANIDDIVMKYEGIVSLSVDISGSLNIKTKLTELKDYLPKSYQIINGREVPVSVKYHLIENNRVGFTADNYNHDYPLIIDPVLLYSTFIGGSLSDYQWVGGIDRDINGNIFHTGRTFSSNFPTSIGSHQTVFGGDYDTYVFKLDPTGTTLIYSTFIGGAGADAGYSIKLDQGSGELWIVGSTDSPTFPTTVGAFQTSLGGTGLTDAFVLKLNSAGNTILYSSLFGQAFSDYGHGIDIDNAGYVYITGESNGTAHTTSGAFQSSYGGGPWDGWVVKFDPTLSTVLYSTLFGGSGEDVPISIKVDQNNDVYIAGFQSGGNMPIVAGSYDVSYNGGSWDGFVVKFNSMLSNTIYSTYLGSSGTDMIWNALQVTNLGEAIIAGFASPGFPTTIGAFQTVHAGGVQDAFVTKLNSSGTALMYSTLVGGSGSDQAYGLYLEPSGEVYITGLCHSNFPMTVCTYDSTFNGSSDAFIVKLNSDVSQLLFSTYVGGASIDIGYNITVLNNVIYVAGETQSLNFPVTGGANDTTYNGSKDVFVIAMIASSTDVLASFNSAISVCVNSPVLFNNTSLNASSFQWDFGDGTTDILQNPTHLYLTPGTHQVRLIANSQCAIPDTFYLSIQVNDSPLASFSQIINCDLSVNFSGPSNTSSIYSWDFGDSNYSSQSSPTHAYLMPGTFDVTLTETNVFGCVDTFQSSVTIAPAPSSVFLISSNPCAAEVTLTNSSLNSTSFIWQFGDGEISSLNSPDHTYLYPGIYVVTLIAKSGVCVDTSFQSVSIGAIPVASFYEQNNCNLTTLFTNSSTGSINSFWDFGDATTSSAGNVTHSYSTDGYYTVTLIVSNSLGCTDTVQNQIYVPPVSLAAFSYSSTICSDIISFTNGSSNSNSLIWSFGDGNTSTIPDPVHQYGNSGTFQVMLIANPGQCADTMSQFISINSVPKADFSGVSSCRQLYSFSNLSGGSINTFEWDFGDNTTSFLSAPIHTYPTTGMYTVQLKISDLNNCKDSITKVIMVTDDPIASFSFTQPICNSVITFSNTSAYGINYQWDFGDGTSSFVSWPTHNFLNSGNYIVRLIADPFGCSDTTEQQVTIQLPPIVDFGVESDCKLLSVFENTSIDTAINFVWSFGDGSIDNSISPSHQYYQPGNYNVSLVGVNSTGCSDTILKKVNALLFEEAIISTSFDTCKREAIFEGSVIQSGNYSWSLGEDSPNANRIISKIYEIPGTYPVQLVTNPGTTCADTLNRTIEIPEQPFHGLYIPNCFTPNGDGLNEVFEVIDFGFCDNYELLIFNRWGELIFETSDLSISWDGTFSGELVPVGVYAWVLRSNLITKQGAVSVLK